MRCQLHPHNRAAPPIVYCDTNSLVFFYFTCPVTLTVPDALPYMTNTGHKHRLTLWGDTEGTEIHFTQLWQLPVISGSLSPQHGTSPGCRWRNSLLICKVAVTILNKQSRQSTRGGPPAWRLGEVLTTPHHKNLIMLQNIQRSSGIRLTLQYNTTGSIWLRIGTGGELLWMQ
jgi:hypothetical protein